MLQFWQKLLRFIKVFEMKKNQTEKNLDEDVNIRPNNNLLKTIQSMILIIVLILLSELLYLSG